MNLHNTTGDMLLAISSIHKRISQRWFDDEAMESRSKTDHALVSLKAIRRDAEKAIEQIESNISESPEPVKQEGAFNVRT